MFLECSGLFILCKVIPFQDFILAKFNSEVKLQIMCSHNMWTVEMRYVLFFK